MQLRNNNETVGVAWGHVVALVYQTQSDATVQRRQDTAILQVDLGGFDRRAVGFHRALVLRNQSHLRVERLTRHCILRSEALIAGQIDLRAFGRAWSRSRFPFAWASVASYGRGSISAIRSPLLTSSPSLKSIFIK